MKKLLLLLLICVFVRAEAEDLSFPAITEKQKRLLQKIHENLNNELDISSGLIDKLHCENRLFGTNVDRVNACLVLRDMLNAFGYPQHIVKPIDESLRQAIKWKDKGVTVI